MQAKLSDKLTARDFVYCGKDEVFGQCYQNGPYLIGVGRSTYACTYKGQTFSWGLESFTEAIRACAKHDAARRNSQDVLENAVLLEIAKLERRTGVRVTHRAQAHLYTRRCENTETGLTRYQEGK